MKLLLFITSIILITNSFGQKEKIDFGFQFNPIIPNRFVGHDQQAFNYLETPNFNGSFDQKVGFVFGGLLKRKISNSISIETGINYVQRNYNISYLAEDSGYDATSNVTLISYSIPVSGIFYVKLSESWYMNTALGLNFSFFPSTVASLAKENNNRNRFYQQSYPTGWFQLGVNANYGFEYRTNKSGTFYIGATYNLPIKPIMDSYMIWRNYSNDFIIKEEIDGSYLTAVFKYYFNKN